jgi:putative glutamine amidotransferase
MALEGFGENRKIYVVGGSTGYASWMRGHLVSTIEEANLVVFTGGQDVCPLVYNQTDIHPKTYYTLERDNYEILAYNKALKLGKKMIGICRGHQLLSVLNGTTLIQDQPNPGNHFMITYKGESILINSLHHQAVYPFDLPKEEYLILGYTNNILKHHHNGKSEEMHPKVEVEAIYFPKTNCLGIQCHPEMMAYQPSLFNDALNFFNLTLNRFMMDLLFFKEEKKVEQVETV